MTINEFLGSLPNMKSPDGHTLAETMADQMPVWSNAAASGYLIAALQLAGYDRDEIFRVLKCQSEAFHTYTVDGASKFYYEY